jgi:FixJ family two-component response regulator
MTIKPNLVAIVDDDGSVRMALGSLVRSLGYRVLTFASAEEFVAAKTDGLDCLVCDINMPGMSGWDLLEWMQVNGRAVPTIVISAFADRKGGRPMVPEVQFFAKPFDADLMAEAIKGLITQGG